MNFTCFHLMPYRPLDFTERKKHRSAWVVLPNSLYDPKKGAEEYQSYLDQLTFAEELGFDAIGVNEHHQTAYGMMPAPNLIASALIQRTKRVKIAILGRALPLTNNPVTIAEEFAMLDNLSKGRIIAGFVRGIGTEYHATGLNPAFSLERFQEAHDLIVSAWTRAGAVRVRRRALQFPLRQPVAAALPDAASADLDSFDGVVGNHPLGVGAGAQISVPGHLQRAGTGDALSQQLPRAGATTRL